MEIKLKLDQIKPYPANAKYHPKKQIQQIANSIKAFGFNQPIVVDKNNTIIVGHGRYEAAKVLGLSEVPVVKLTLTEEQTKAYRLADNKLNESDWDMKLVIEELKELSAPMFDLTGFDKDLIIDPEEKDDQIPESAPAVSKLGDLYELGPHRVLCGDSTSREAVLALCGEVKSDMAFTDPPWNVAIGGDGNPRHRQRTGLINDDLGKEFLPFLQGFATNLVEFNKGDVYCVMGCEEWPNIHKALTEVGLHWSASIIWAKDVFVLGRAKYHRRFEPIWYGWRTKSSYCGDRKQDDVWEVKRPKRSDEHPTMKPVELCERAIKNSSVRDDYVMDLFGGGGSTLIACQKLERKCLMMELSPGYVDVIVQRYCDYVGNYDIIKNGKKFKWPGRTKGKG